MAKTPVVFIDHHIAQIQGVDPQLLKNKKRLLEKTLKITKDLNLTVVKSYIHKFKPQGLSLVLVIAQSHLAIHTWPELSYMHVDVLSCSPKSKLEKLAEVLKKQFKPTKIFSKKIRY